MVLVSDIVSLNTGELIHSEIVEENLQVNIEPLVYHYVSKLVENEKTTNDLVGK